MDVHQLKEVLKLLNEMFQNEFTEEEKYAQESLIKKKKRYGSELSSASNIYSSQDEHYTREPNVYQSI